MSEHDIKLLRGKPLNGDTALAAACARGYATVFDTGDVDMIAVYIHEWMDSSIFSFIADNRDDDDKDSMVMAFKDGSVMIIKRGKERDIAMATDVLSLWMFFDINGGVEKKELEHA